MAEVERAGRSSQPGRLRQVVSRYGRHFDPQRMVKDAIGAPLRDVVREIHRYGKKSVTRKLVDEFLSALGPTGKLLKALAGGRQGKGDLRQSLDAATALLQAHGHVVIAPPKPATAASGALKGTEALVEHLEGLGYRILSPEEATEKPAPKSRLPFGISETTSRGQPRKTVELENFGANKTRLPVDHPGVTGEFVKVDSSNVYEIAYDAEGAFLYVRFRATEGRGTGKRLNAPGSLYRYRNVEPRDFKQFYEAASKGEWVWDHLRIRGTVAGHQKPYALVGVMDGYVPREATYVGQGLEEFRKRRLHAGGGKWLQSERPTELVGGNVNRGLPNTGRPKRPNNGRGNTGRPN